MNRLSLDTNRWFRRALIAACMPLLFAVGCDDGGGVQDEADVPYEPPAFDPYEDAAHLRFVHLAPSFANLVVNVERPANQYGVDEAEMPVRMGDPVLRSITPDAPVSFSGFVAGAAPVPTSARLTIEQNNNIVDEQTFDGLESGETYYVAFVESAGQSAIELLPVTNPRDGVGDGRAHLGIFNADAELGTVDVAVQAVGGGDSAQWGGLAFGDKSNLVDLQDVAPGEYQLAIVRGTDPVPMVAPDTLTLEADSVVHMMIAPGVNDGELPRLLFVTDVGELERFEGDPAGEYIAPPEEM